MNKTLMIGVSAIALAAALSFAPHSLAQSNDGVVLLAQTDEPLSEEELAKKQQEEADQAAADEAAAAQAAADQAAADEAARVQAEAEKAAADDAAAAQAAADQAAADEAARIQAEAEKAAGDDAAAAQAAADQAAADEAARIQAEADKAAADEAAKAETGKAAADEAARIQTEADKAAADEAAKAGTETTQPTAETTPPIAEPDASGANAPVLIETVTPEAQKLAVEEAKLAPTVSPEALQPKDIVADVPLEKIIDQAALEPLAVVSDDITTADRQALKIAESQRREKARDERDELIGAFAVGVVVGAIVPLLGGTVAADEGDRIVVQRDDGYFVRKDDSALFRDADYEIGYENMRGNLIRETVTRADGSQIITIRDQGGYVLRREKITRFGERIVLFDTVVEEIVRPYHPVVLHYEVEVPQEYYVVSARRANRELFYDTFQAPPVYKAPKRYSLRDIRENENVRSLVRRIDLDTINFASGSAFMAQSQVRFLGDIAGGILDTLEKNPAAVFLIEGHTDAVGPAIANLTLSDRRAESVARVLSEAYGIPPENMVVQGYGESYLKVRTQRDERANRRVTVRNISPILQVDYE